MPLTDEEKIQLARTYAPILYFHPDEQFFPIRPEAYLNGAALWQSTPPADEKIYWGKDLNVWPRQPTIPKMGISVHAAEDVEGTSDPDRDGVNEWYLGHKLNDSTLPYLQSNAEKELWLESSGWAKSEIVDEESDNKHCNKEDALQKWQETGFGGLFSNFYYAEVQESSDIERMFISLGSLDGKPILDTISELLGELYIVWYYFLYPIHEEYLRRCEQVFEPGTERRGDYEGDWNAVGVVIQKNAVLSFNPTIPMPKPVYVAYGIRLRGISKDIVPSLFKQGMVIRKWDTEVSKLPGSLHPRVFVTKGYHNNYSLPGNKNPLEIELLGIPISKLTCELTEAVDEAANDAKETLEDIREILKDVGITITKIAAGAEIGFNIGGPFGGALGALGGALGGIIEGLSSSNTADIPPEEVRKELEMEQGPPDHQYGLVLKPFDVVNPLLPSEPAHPETTETAEKIQNWMGTDKEKLVDRSKQIWWPGDKGYNGLWGVKCENDPNNRRSGISFPDFRRALMNDLAIHLSKTVQ